MIGAIIGDIVGSRFEFNNTFEYDFELFHKDCNFTDDTICTIAIADALIRKISYQDALLEWCRKFPHPMGGYGGSFARWIHQENPQPYNSFGNGAAMRVAPVAWYFKTEEEVLREAAKTAACTHNHPEGIKGAQAVALAIHRAFEIGTDRAKNAIAGVALEYYPGCLETTYRRGVFDETCQGTVPVAFNIVLGSISFEDAIRNAISWGGDSDTIGAIVGAMAEAIWGIPRPIYQNVFCYVTDEMNDIIGNFFKSALTNEK